MKLTLTRPLVFFDLETTGVDPYNDRIVQLAAIKYFPDGQKTTHEWIVNPGMPIPKGASDIHGITDDMVQDKPLLGDLTKDLATLFDGVDLGGYNVKNFDIPLLAVEFERIGLPLDTEQIKIVDAMKIFQIKEPRTLTAAYKKFCGKELTDAHDAMADIVASVEVLEGQMAQYDDVPSTVTDLHDFCFPHDPDAFDAEGKLRFVDGALTINFGKNKGKSLQFLSTNDPGYLEWILKSNFSDKVKEALRDVLK
ncbi:MAG: 3'-5' exonuclease [Candidatus Magasanikbacteria bacterium]|uniref:DNA polymerase III subunit epsilon n=1 Tax=Candidatus Magasanikbacteria bacterium CG10_big_fil_rev_8_21_14_0_10_38_6 TaxID=1974647 RepID=A0A2M6P2W1_9BACT|nr:3'-5' exonuclease [Candidatus Magasanikbacteria bacterium]NCS71746.1 3'-5' exonuclease [Candidatus Magasanikbacteria bacterium]PIR77849.1 MAG: DNA polymerase III subunit epsilon [Candidatus Magasanikbacteria bacterium CG10_big_fil_rev_8_21_14_0_10_38_6]